MKRTTLLVLFTVNSIYMVLAFIPAFCCFALTLEGWFPPGYQHPDNPFGRSSGDELWALTFASFLLLVFFCYTLCGPKGFYNDRISDQKSLYHFQLVLVTNVLTLTLFITSFGEKTLANTFSKPDLLTVILLSPMIPLIISLVGIIQIIHPGSTNKNLPGTLNQ